MVKSTCFTQMHLCVFVYMHMAFIEHRPYHCIHIHVSHTLYTIGDIGTYRMHEIGRCPPTVNICMRFVCM